MSSAVTFNRAKLLVGTIVFIMLFGFVRNIILDNPLDTKALVVTAVLFIIWQGLSDSLTTAFIGSRQAFSVSEGGYKPPTPPTCP